MLMNMSQNSTTIASNETSNVSFETHKETDMKKLWLAGLLSATVSVTTFAATEITWWHAMGGATWRNRQ